MSDKLINKSIKIIVRVFAALAITLVLLSVYLNSKWGQARLSKLLFDNVSERIGTPVSGKLSFSIPSWVKVDDLLIIGQKSDTLLYAGKARFDVALFKLLKNQLVIDQVNLEDLVAKVDYTDEHFNFDYLLDAFGSDDSSVDENPLQITLDKIRLKKLRAEYRDTEAKQYFNVSLGDLKTGFNLMDLDKDIYDLKDIRLKNLKVYGDLGETTDDSSGPLSLPDIKLKNFIADNIEWDMDLGEYLTNGNKADIKISFNSLNLPENKIDIKAVQSSIATLSLKNKNTGQLPEGEINFDDLQLSRLKLLAENISIGDAEQSATLKTFSFIEKSGFELKSLAGRIEVKNDVLTLNQFEVKAAESYLISNITTYLNTKDYTKSRFKADVNDLKLNVSDALFFDRSLNKNPEFRKLEKDFVKGSGKLNGTLEEINVEKLTLLNSNRTKLDLSGKIFNQKPLGFNLNVNQLYLSDKDVDKFINQKKLAFEIPRNIRLSGKVNGTMDNLKLLANLQTNQGGGKADLTLKNLSKTPSYTGNILIDQYNLGLLFKDEDIGRLTADLNFEGNGFDNPSLSFDGLIKEVAYQDKILRDIKLEGDLKDEIARLKGVSTDPIAQISLDIVADLSGSEPKIKGETHIERIDLYALGLIDEKVSLSGDLDIEQLVIDMKRPNIDITGRNVIVYKDSVSYEVGNISLFTSYGETSKSIYLFTDFADISLSGNFEYDQLNDIALGEVDKYFEIPDFVPVSDSLNYYFDIDGVVNYHPVITAFLPSVLDFETIVLQSNLNSDSAISFSGNIDIPYLLYDSVKVVKTGFDFSGDGKKLDYVLLSQQISNESFRLRKASISGKLADNKADFALSVKDSLDAEIHSLSGFLSTDGKKVKIGFNETGTMLFYQNWGGNPYGYIEYSDEGLRFENIVFSMGNQLVRVNNLGNKVNSPLMVYIRNLDLNFFSKAFLQDSTYLAGNLKLDLVLDNYLDDKPISFDGLATVSDFVLDGMDLGKLTLKAETENNAKISLLGTLDGKKGGLELSGAYYAESDEPLDLKLSMDQFNPKLFEIFMDELIYDLSGDMYGKVTVKGSLDRPEINGEVGLRSGELRIVETAALLKIENQKISLKESSLNFDNFIIKDAHGETMNLDGTVSLASFSNITYNIDITSDNFMIADSKKGQSELFYGTAFLKSNLNFSGTNTDFHLSGDIFANGPTNLTLLLPEDDFGVDLNKVVTFTEFNNPDRQANAVEGSDNTFANALNVNVFADEKSTISILMDPVSGDKLSGQGIVNLNVGFDNAGDLFMVGNLDIKKGFYDLTFQTINKHFEITEQSMSSISFTGDPLKGRLNVTAEYKVPGKKDIIQYPELKGKDIKTSKLLTDLRVDLVLTGEIMSPDIDFQIVAKKDEINDIDLQNTLEEVGLTLVNDKGIKSNAGQGAVTSAFNEILKQNAIMLLVANNFTATQILESFTSATGAGYEDLARRNASQIISSQLERYASGLIKGVDLNVGLQSSGGYSETGSDRSTNVNLGVSKAIANNRLVVSVGKNFELENKDRQSEEVFDNVEANWMITPEGRYRLKVFRKTQNQTAVEGSVIETGLGFIIAIDYDTWLELIKKKK